MSNLVALDLFAGTGWGVACQRLGIKEYGVEIDKDARATREANGMETIFCDVWDGLNGVQDVPRYDLLIASPPCQTFSLAGKGAGRRALDDVLEAVWSRAYESYEALRDFGVTHDDRTALVLSPLAYVYRDRPRFIVLEQVPSVKPVWDAYALVLREWGYDVVVDVVSAEQYGVPQTRKRAILMAVLNGKVSSLVPTHSRYYPRTPERLDAGVLPWVSMADALGWGAVDQPCHTVTAGTHGASDRYASGGSSVRLALDAKIGTPVWIDKKNVVADNRTTYSQRFDVEDISLIQTYPVAHSFLRSNYGSGGDGANRGERLVCEPAATVTSKANRNKWDGVVSLSEGEASVFQTYPAGGFVWCGTKTKKFLQIGNAVPPLLAEVILKNLVFSV